MTEAVQRAGVRPWHVPMRGRVRDEPHGTATTLLGVALAAAWITVPIAVVTMSVIVAVLVAVNVVSMQRERPGLPDATVMTDTPERSSGPRSSHGG